MNVEAELLALWERAAAAAPGWRDDALLSLAGVVPAALGARNAALLKLRSRILGPAQALTGECPQCGTPLEFAVDCDALAAGLPPPADTAAPQRLEACGHAIDFRLPDAADLRAAAAAPDFVPALFEHCVRHCERADGTPCEPDELAPEAALALSARMEALDPGASVSFDLACPECGAHWSATLDVGAAVWAEVQARAERVLLDVAALARAWGWSEAEVLALSPVRRAAYLQLAGAA